MPQDKERRRVNDVPEKEVDRRAEKTPGYGDKPRQGDILAHTSWDGALPCLLGAPGVMSSFPPPPSTTFPPGRGGADGKEGPTDRPRQRISRERCCDGAPARHRSSGGGGQMFSASHSCPRPSRRRWAMGRRALPPGAATERQAARSTRQRGATRACRPVGPPLATPPRQTDMLPLASPPGAGELALAPPR